MSTAAIQGFWRDLRKGNRVKRQSVGKSHNRTLAARGPSKLESHRAQLENDAIFRGEFDALIAAEKAAKQGKKRGVGITVPRRKLA